MTTITDLETMARAAGAAGEEWQDFTYRDDVQTIVMVLDEAPGRLDLAPVETAYADGRAAWRIASGWRVMWTTAPADYDQFGTTTIETCGEWRGKQLRRVLANPQHASYQADRYGSGLHPCFDDDPREADRIAKERWAKLDADRLAHEAKRAAGLQWLAACDAAALDDTDANDPHD